MIWCVLLPYRFTLFSNIALCKLTNFVVLLHYRFTLFSNYHSRRLRIPTVLLPYRFTLFSNPLRNSCANDAVLLPYRFTLFSNIRYTVIVRVQFYYLIDLHYSQTSNLKLGIKCTHYTMHGKSIRLFYNICIMIVNKIHTNHYQSQQVFRIQKLLSVLSFQC